MTLQQFLEKHKDYYLTALDNDIRLEVDSSKRRKHVTDEEEVDLKEIGWVNVLSSSDLSMCCCGVAMFKKDEFHLYKLQLEVYSELTKNHKINL